MHAGELADTRVGLVAIADAVYQSTGDRIGTTQRRPVRQGIHFGGVELARHRHTVPNLFRQTLQQSSVGLPLRVGVAVFGEKICRRLVLATREELCLHAGLVERTAQECPLGRESDEPHRSGRLHPHLAERRRKVIGKRARIRL
ncbi:Uncharacterised protein [Mycobacteroides abscessus subsp. massiliense]|nr:Uncharacterised protein [Mycobacteroides abscessus subsp. massiliense]